MINDEPSKSWTFSKCEQDVEIDTNGGRRRNLFRKVGSGKFYLRG